MKPTMKKKKGKINKEREKTKKKMSSSSSRHAFEDGKYKTDLLTVDSSSRCCKTPLSSSPSSPSPPKQLLVATPVEEGEYPVVMLLHGYLLYNTFYSQLMLHVSSHGFILIAPQVQFTLIYKLINH